MGVTEKRWDERLDEERAARLAEWQGGVHASITLAEPAMLDTLRQLIADSLLTVPEPDPPIEPGDIRIAACALLLTMAHADKRLSRDERGVIRRSLVTHFGVDERGAIELIAAAEREWEAAPDEQAFAAQVRAEYDEDQRQILADLLWDVASADGWIETHEALLVTKTAQWLGIERG
jgi:uncharacterized tellurite resistance protein B-like protein